MNLGTEGISFDFDVEQLQGVLFPAHNSSGHHDHAHACAPNRHSFGGSLF